MQFDLIEIVKQIHNQEIKLNITKYVYLYS